MLYPGTSLGWKRVSNRKKSMGGGGVQWGRHGGFKEVRGRSVASVGVKGWGVGWGVGSGIMVVST